jgi:hypothetical protein
MSQSDLFRIDLAENGKQNYENVKYKLRKLENPNPIFTIAVFCITVMMVIILLRLIKGCKFDGVWVDDNDVKYVISRNVFINRLNIKPSNNGNMLSSARIYCSTIETNVKTRGFINEASDVITFVDVNGDKVLTLRRYKSM